MLIYCAVSPHGARGALGAIPKEILMSRLLIAATAVFTCVVALAQTPKADGEITKIDKAQARITLRHGEIKNLEMPPMTMVFRVRDANMLDRVAVGDKVRFNAEKLDGYYTVTAIDKAP